MASEASNYNKVVSLDSFRSAERPPKPLKGGGGGSTMDPMEPRVATLETLMKVTREDLAAIKQDVGSLKTDMAVLKEKVSQLPGKGFIVTVSLSALSIVAAITLFQSKIISLFISH